MTLICRMVFTTFFFPVIIGWEEGVGLCRGVVDLCQTETVCQRERLLIHTRTSDDIDILVFSAVLEGFLQ